MGQCGLPQHAACAATTTPTLLTSGRDPAARHQALLKLHATTSPALLTSRRDPAAQQQALLKLHAKPDRGIDATIEKTSSDRSIGSATEKTSCAEAKEAIQVFRSEGNASNEADASPPTSAGFRRPAPELRTRRSGFESVREKKRRPSRKSTGNVGMKSLKSTKMRPSLVQPVRKTCP